MDQNRESPGGTGRVDRSGMSRTTLKKSLVHNVSGVTLSMSLTTVGMERMTFGMQSNAHFHLSMYKTYNNTPRHIENYDYNMLMFSHCST